MALRAWAGPLLLLGTIGGSVSPRVVTADVLFSDTEMLTSSWTEVELLDLNGDFVFNVVHETGGGNPGANRRIVHATTTAPNGDVTLGHFHTASQWNPSVQGAISHVLFELDANVIDGGGSDAVGYNILIRQGGNHYVATPFEAALEGAGWTHFASTPLTASDFVGYPSFSGSPDFSPAGANIEFGFVSSNGLDAPIFSNSRVDNWEVTVVEAPSAPIGGPGLWATLALLLSCAGVWKARTRSA